MPIKDFQHDKMIPAYKLLEGKFQEPPRGLYQCGWNDALQAAYDDNCGKIIEGDIINMRNAYQVYRSTEPTEENGIRQFKCICSECGCPVFSDEFPSERECCPHCKAEFSGERIMSFDMWRTVLYHVSYSNEECGREK